MLLSFYSFFLSFHRGQGCLLRPRLLPLSLSLTSTSNSNDLHELQQASKSRNGPPLQLVRVVQAEQQVVAGMNYRVIVEAVPSSSNSTSMLAEASNASATPPKPALYTAVVYQPPGAGVPMQLTSWKDGPSLSG